MTDSPISRLLSRLEGVEERDGFFIAKCPAHNDTRASLSISESPDGKALVNCHAGCETRRVVVAAGMTMSELFPGHGLTQSERDKQTRAKKRGKLVASYDYRDAEGVLIYQACRFEKTEDGIKSKTFTQRRPNGEGGFIYSMKGVTKVPYRLPDILKAPGSEPLIIVEGEKHVDKLFELGFVASCNVGGAGKWLKSYSELLKGRDVVILPDNDEPGEKHAKQVERLFDGLAKSVSVIELPGLPVKGDVLDWLEAGGNAQALREIIKSPVQRDRTKEPSTEIPVASRDDQSLVDLDRQVIEKLQIDVLGEREDGSIKVFSEFHRKAVFIKDAAKLNFQSLLQLCGPVTRRVVYRGQDETPSGMVSVTQVKDSIAVLAGYRRLNDQSDLGAGCWEGRNDEGQQKMLLIGAGEAVIANGQTELLKHMKPRFGDQLLDLNSSDPWFDQEALQECYRDVDEIFSTAVALKLEEVFAKWAYKQQETIPKLLTGLVFSTWVQTIWKWRPQVSISGQSSSGKTTMLSFLGGSEGAQGIFGGLAIKSSQSSAAGVRQAVRNTAKILICDEFESSRHRREILEMLRGSGRGDKTLRGSSNHKHVEFHLNHIVWTAAIESGLQAEADRNRFIAIELVKPAQEGMGKLELPGEEEIRQLSHESLAVAIKISWTAREVAANLRKRRPSGFHERVIESYAVPVACYSVAIGMTEDEAVELLHECLVTSEPDTDEGDDVNLMNAILESEVRCENEQRTIGMLIERCEFSIEAKSVLEAKGIALSRDEGWMFLAHNTVKRNLLDRTEWGDKRIDQILQRMPGAQKVKHRIGGRRPWGIKIPFEFAT